MILGTGIDLIEVARIADSIARFGARFLERIFTRAEIDYCERHQAPALHFAARFAAKEACLKALGTGWANGLRFTHIEVQHDARGMPRMQLLEQARSLAIELGVGAIHVSLTHTEQMAAAVVILER
ncbi:MAG: holo-ACP synthase [Planctomycetota bacterium]